MIGLGSRLRAAREAREWTQYQLGRAVGIRDNDVSRYERDVVEPRIDVLVRIADALGVSLDYLGGRHPRLMLETPWVDVSQRAASDVLADIPVPPEDPDGAERGPRRPPRKPPRRAR